MGERSQKGFTVFELVIAGTVGMLVVGSGLMLYRSQTKMHLRQNDVNEAQLTVDYVTNTIRTIVVSAGGGLPQGANGLRKGAGGRGLSSYVNREDRSAIILDELNVDATDGIFPVTDITPFDGTGYVMISRNEECMLAEMHSVNTAEKKVRIKDASLESRMVGADFIYPVEYCSLYVDNAGYLRKTILAEGSAWHDIPLAINIDSLDISYDLSPEGNGAFTRNLADSNKVSRVKLFVRVKGSHALAGSSKRSFETIVGVRRGRLYNRTI